MNSAESKTISSLIIEPEFITRLAISRCLRAEGIKVSYVSTISDISKHMADVVIVSAAAGDSELLLDFLRRQKRDDNKLILITSWTLQEEISELRLPRCVLLLKPLLCHDIVRIIRDAFPKSLPDDQEEQFRTF